MIRTDSLVHEYEGTRALDGVSLDIADGEFVVLAGANGSGKTTLVRHFNGLLEPDAGDVRVNGTPVSENLVAARASVGMVFQDPRDQFVAGTVREDVAFGPENLGLPREEVDERVIEALDAVNMSGRGDELLSRLSGGEQERVAIAGVLAMRPDHVVLDEPFTGLDQPARESVLDRLDALHESGTSLVVVTHDLRDVLSRADRVCLLSEGRVLADGPPEDVRERLPEASVRDPC
ncbi:energy-coupling factor ABC transporter ATP-binding protein [Salarchaeum japonicum]|uniref:energy-coupling factor ABC transporter ATP-binding protein n=1 Tax=Salarchaeum japonicum TaxID=555573 RepID=UPI003C76ECF9